MQPLLFSLLLLSSSSLSLSPLCFSFVSVILELTGLKKPAFRRISLGWFSKNRLDIRGTQPYVETKQYRVLPKSFYVASYYYVSLLTDSCWETKLPLKRYCTGNINITWTEKRTSVRKLKPKSADRERTWKFKETIVH